jgi:endothelin-converting enzyme/putative endopeptidase
MLGLHGFGNTRQMAQTVMDIETQLADNHWTKEKNRDPVKTYNLFSYDEVKTMIPSLNWDHWERATGINDLTEIVVHQPDYLTALETILVSTPVEDWKTYYKWRLITASASFMNADIDQEDFHFYRNVLSGVKKQEPRWKRGVSVVNGTIGEIIGKIYVERHFNAEAKRRMTKLVENLRQAFEVGINELEWMSDNTKVQAQDKLMKFRPKIGYPNKWKDYSKIIINSADLLGNMKNVTLVLTKQNRDKLGQPVDRDEWFMTPQTVNAYYNPALNEIVFPAAILQPPFFNLEADDAVNYGAIGAVIGHEMGHGFDDSGSQYDGDGVLRNWWKSEDRDEFNNRTKMLIDQYNQFTVVNGTSVNGEFTQGENIGDLTGATIAYKAYQISKEASKASVIDGLTGEQRFFYGWGRIWGRKYRNEELLKRIKTDPHSPGEFRANGPLVNMPEFIKAFDIKAGDKMYLDRDKRVKIW